MSSLWILLAAFCFALMNVIIKVSSDTLSVAEMLFYRSLINLIIVVGVMKVQKVGIKSNVTILHFRRAALGNIALVCSFFALSTLPVSMATTLNYTNPLFLAIISIFFTKDKVAVSTYVGIVIGFVGVVQILNPSLEIKEYLGSFSGLLSGFFTALAYYNVGLLVKSGEPETRVVFYFSLTGVLCSFIWLSFNHFSHVDLNTFLHIIEFGFLGTCGQLAMTRAYGNGRTLITGTLSYMTIVFATLLTWVLFDEKLDWQGLFGILLIVAGGLLVIRPLAHSK